MEWQLPWSLPRVSWDCFTSFCLSLYYFYYLLFITYYYHTHLLYFIVFITITCLRHASYDLILHIYTLNFSNLISDVVITLSATLSLYIYSFSVPLESCLTFQKLSQYKFISYEPLAKWIELTACNQARLWQGPEGLLVGMWLKFQAAIALIWGLKYFETVRVTSLQQAWLSTPLNHWHSLYPLPNQAQRCQVSNIKF